MKVRNVHQRAFAAGEGEEGELIDGLGQRGDRLWPGERWPPLRLDKPLSEGARGGHGPIRYVVDVYEPGRRVRFRFSRPRGFVGFHEFEVDREDGDAVLRHNLVANMRGAAAISWPAVFRPLHDATIEDALDKAERHLTGSVARPVRWSIRVRFLRWCFRVST